MESRIKVLVGCEESQVVTIAFRERGYDAYSCDILDCSGGHPEWHIKGDILSVLRERENWDLFIAHPPCTRLCNSGVRWLEERNLWDDMRKGAEFFRLLLDTDIPRICIENPIPHKYALDIIGRKYDQIIQPWMFGHGESKATCLWLKNLPLLSPTNIVEGREQRIWKLPRTFDRGQLRSKTYLGIAEAWVDQWGCLLQ